MALPDPLAQVIVNTVEYDLARTGMSADSSVYKSADGLDKFTLSHQVTKNRLRRVARLDRSKIAANPFDADLNQEYSLSTYVVSDIPKLGVSAAEADFHFQLLAGLWASGTPDYGLRFLQGEV